MVRMFRIRICSWACFADTGHSSCSSCASMWIPGVTTAPALVTLTDFLKSGFQFGGDVRVCVNDVLGFSGIAL